MAYSSNEELPETVRSQLPPQALDLYRAAFNHAYAAQEGDPRQEEIADEIAWAAVEREFVKVEGRWVAIR